MLTGGGKNRHCRGVNMKFPVLFQTSGLLLLAVVTAAAAEKRPNILLILADDMGYGDLSCYGSTQVKTPNIDALAAGGVVCTDGYVSNSVCAPSRAGLMTGRYGSRFGFEHNLGEAPDYLKPEYAGIPQDEPTIADRLRALGYRTGMSGKWHLGETLPSQKPNARGFDFFFGMTGGGHDYFPDAKKNALSMNRNPVTSIRTPYLTDWITLEALDFIRGEGVPAETAGDTGRPWFLYLSYNSPHTPMQAKPEDLARYPDIRPARRRTYCAMQSSMDDNIGRIFAELKRRGEWDDTLVIFASDNGGSVEASYAVNAPLRGGKGTFFEGGVRVPLIVSWPAKLKHATYREPVISLDFMPTCVAAAGGVPPAKGPSGKRAASGAPKEKIYDGENLTPYFNGEKTGAPHDTLYWRTALKGSAVRSGDWKLLSPATEPPMLFNLREDIGESHDLATRHPDIVRRLTKLRVDWETTLERAPMFMSPPHYLDLTRKLYERSYPQTQPAPGDATDAWAMPRAAEKPSVKTSGE